jgi:hypothetical protein
MAFEGFVFTVAPPEAEQTPQEKARARLDMSLDDLVRESTKNRPHDGDATIRNRLRQNQRGPRDQNVGRPVKYVDLDMSEHEISRYLSFADLDAEGHNVRLRLAMVRSQIKR